MSTPNKKIIIIIENCFATSLLHCHCLLLLTSFYVYYIIKLNNERKVIFMPQKLKQEVKDRIINAALDLILESGFNNADMRSIAKNAGITHGNLYRYFKSKDDLMSYLTQPLLNSMNELLTFQTSGTIKIFDDNINDFMKMESQYSTETIFENISVIIFENVKVFYIKGKQNPKAMRVILQNNILLDNIINWLKDIGLKGFKDVFDLNSITQEEAYVFSVLLESFATGFCKGIAVILENNLENDNITFEKTLKRYIHLQLQYLQLVTIKQIETNNTPLKREE